MSLPKGPPEYKIRRLRRGCEVVRTSHIGRGGGLLRSFSDLLERIEEDLLEIECDIRDSRQEWRN